MKAAGAELGWARYSSTFKALARKRNGPTGKSQAKRRKQLSNWCLLGSVQALQVMQDRVYEVLSTVCLYYVLYCPGTVYSKVQA